VQKGVYLVGLELDRQWPEEAKGTILPSDDRPEVVDGNTGDGDGDGVEVCELFGVGSSGDCIAAESDGEGLEVNMVGIPPDPVNKDPINGDESVGDCVSGRCGVAMDVASVDT